MARLSRRKREVGLYIYGCFETPLVCALCGLALGAAAAPVIDIVASCITNPHMALWGVLILMPPFCIFPAIYGAYYGTIAGLVAGVIAGSVRSRFAFRIGGLIAATVVSVLGWGSVFTWSTATLTMVAGVAFGAYFDRQMRQEMPKFEPARSVRLIELRTAGVPVVVKRVIAIAAVAITGIVLASCWMDLRSGFGLLSG